MANWVLGLTGGIGSGKTAASDYLQSLGIGIVDADLIARQVVAPGEPALAAIAAHFGAQALQADGSLNRAWLRQQVFSHPQQRQWLEQLTHPLIRQTILQALSAATSNYVVLVSPLLIESGQQALTTRTLVVDVPPELQWQRASQRDHNSPEQIRAIMAAQINREQRLQAAHDVVDNSGTLADLHQQLLPLHQQYLQMAAAASPSDESQA